VNPAVIGSGVSSLLIYIVSLVFVVWAVIDVGRRPTWQLSRGKKAAWIIASVVGWLLVGYLGAFVAIFYLVGPRRRLTTGKP
jgi:hypothetical protein